MQIKENKECDIDVDIISNIHLLYTAIYISVSKCLCHLSRPHVPFFALGQRRSRRSGYVNGETRIGVFGHCEICQR